jgi:MFS family permease
MDRKDVDTAVAENTHLRGLYGVLGGLLAIIAALSNDDRGPSIRWFFGIAVLVLGLATFVTWRYYNKNFGRATPSSRDSWRSVVTMTIGVVVLIVGSLFLSSRASWSLDLPVNTTAMGMGWILLVAVAASVGIRPHHLFIYGALFIAGAIPVWERGGMSGNTGLYMAGAAMIVGGLLDHRLLVQRFGSATALEQEDDRAGIQ